MSHAAEPATFGRRGLNKTTETPRAVRTNIDEIDISTTMIFNYIGHNTHKYQGVVEALEQKRDGFRGIALSWNWGAFFFPELWLLYRKRWAAAAGMVFLTMIMAFMFPKQSIALLPFRFALAAMAKSLYVNTAAAHIKRIVAKASEPSLALAAIRAGGGVSATAVWLYFGFWVVVGFAIAIQAGMAHHGLH